MNKKIILQILTALILILFVVGCTSKPDQNDNSQQTTEDQNIQPNEDENNVNIETANIAGEQSTLHTVKGKSNGVLPYAPIDENKAVTWVINENGGVVSTELTNGMKMYVIIPEGEIMQDAIVSILPYKEMPSGENHFALSDELGYGAQVVIGSVQRGIKVYVVFDTKGKAGKSENIWDRCDVSKKWFNPIICARINKADPKKTVDKEYAIVSPIFGNANLVLPRSTVPTGIDGLIVAEIEGGDVFVPQKLDKVQAKKIVKQAGKYGNAMENLEAAALANAWDIVMNREQINSMVDSINVATESYAQYKKAILVGKELYGKYAAMGALSEDDALVYGDLKESSENAQEQFFDDLNGDSVGLSDNSIIEGGAASGDLASTGISGAEAGAGEVAGNLQDGIESNSGEPSSAGDVVNGGEALDNINRDKAMEVLPNLQEGINNVVNDPGSSIEVMLQAAALAQALGLDDLADKLIEKIKNKLAEMLGQNLSKQGFYNLAALAQAVGADNIADSALDKASKLKDTVCDNLVKKSLANYGINECK